MSEMGYVIAPPPVVAVPVAGGGLFPVRRVYCIGRNYAAHALEMGGDPSREPPFFFQKNPDDLDPSGSFPYPKHAQTVHHEVELAVALARGGNDIPVEQALSCVFGYAVAIDMTCRDLQDEAKRLGRPWEIAKAFPARLRSDRSFPPRVSAIRARGRSRSLSTACSSSPEISPR